MRCDATNGEGSCGRVGGRLVSPKIPDEGRRKACRSSNEEQT
jgi:hypothetical protein